jgi:hypothetical protein
LPASTRRVPGCNNPSFSFRFSSSVSVHAAHKKASASRKPEAEGLHRQGYVNAEKVEDEVAEGRVHGEITAGASLKGIIEYGVEGLNEQANIRILEHSNDEWFRAAGINCRLATGSLHHSLSREASGSFLFTR